MNKMALNKDLRLEGKEALYFVLRGLDNQIENTTVYIMDLKTLKEELEFDYPTEPNINEEFTLLDTIDDLYSDMMFNIGMESCFPVLNMDYIECIYVDTDSAYLHIKDDVVTFGIWMKIIYLK